MSALSENRVTNARYEVIKCSVSILKNLPKWDNVLCDSFAIPWLKATSLFALLKHRSPPCSSSVLPNSPDPLLFFCRFQMFFDLPFPRAFISLPSNDPLW